MKKFAFAVLLVLALVLAACGAAEPEVVEVVKTVEVEKVVEVVPEQPKLWFSIFNAKHPVVRLMRLGFWDACQDYGFECGEVLVMEPDVDGYVSAMEQVGALGGAGAVIYNDSDALAAGAEALDEIMPTVSFHKPFEVGASPNHAWVSADTAGYAADAALRIGEKIGGKGIVVTSMSGPGGVEDVVIETFTDTMNKNFPDIEVLDPVYETVEFEHATGKASAQIIANPDLAAVFTSTGAGANAWATALRDTGYEPGQVVVVGMDYTPENLKLIEDGEVWAVVGQPLVEEVYEATVIAYHIAMGWPYEEQNWLPAPFVTAETVDKYKDYSVRSMED